MSDDKALTLVPEIITEHRAVVDASQSGYKNSLQHAIKAGELLNQAREAIKKGWLAWLEEQCPDIPQTTANLYMRLATNKTKIDKQRALLMADEGSLSIREAAKLIPKDPAAAKAAAARKVARDAAKAAAAKQVAADAEAAKRSPNAIQELLECVAYDELFMVMKIIWEEEQIKKLAELIAKHLEDRAEAETKRQAEAEEAEAQPAIAQLGRRQIAPATA
jgi:hypothetical protein